MGDSFRSSDGSSLGGHPLGGTSAGRASPDQASPGRAASCPDSSFRAFLWTAAAIAVAATALSILASIYTRPPNLMLDENYYYPLAEKILAGHYEDGYIIRPPLYPLFLAGIFKVLGTGFGAALVISSILRGLLVFGVAAMGRRYFSSLAGLVAAMLVALYPMLIFTYTRFVSEVIYIPLFLVSFWFLERAASLQVPFAQTPALAQPRGPCRRCASFRLRRWRSLGLLAPPAFTSRILRLRPDSADQWRLFLATGAFAGLAALARSTSLFYTFAVAVWIALRNILKGKTARRGLAMAALLVAGMLVVISPWTARNAIVHKALILIDNSTAYNLWLITSGKTVNQATEEWESWGGQAARQRQGYTRWFEYTREHPGFHLKRMAVVIPKLFTPGGQPDPTSLSVSYGHGQAKEHPALRKVLKIASPSVFWLLFAGGIAGLVLCERDRGRRNLVILTVVYFILIHALTLARPRFLLPMNVLLSIYAGALIAEGLSRLGWTRPGRRPK